MYTNLCLDQHHRTRQLDSSHQAPMTQAVTEYTKSITYNGHLYELRVYAGTTTNFTLTSGAAAAIILLPVALLPVKAIFFK